MGAAKRTTISGLMYHYSIYPNIHIVYVVNLKGVDMNEDKTYEADSVPDTPLTEKEGRVLLDDIQHAIPEDFMDTEN